MEKLRALGARLRQAAAALKRDLPALFLALRCRQTPWYAKALAALTVAYALSPIDLIPDFIPVLGYLDDLLLLPGLTALTVKLIPLSVWQDCRARAAGLWADGRPKRWWYALPIVLFWALIVFLIARALLR